MTSIAIIPARGGSKRIPKKNIKNFLGKPIIAYSIQAAIDSGIFDEVIVSTDSDEIAKIAQEYGADVPFLRSSKNSNDFATTTDVIIEVLGTYKKMFGKEFDFFACIYPTAPFVTAKKLKSAFQKLRDSNANSILTITKYSYPPQRAFIVKEDKVSYINPSYIQTRSQDLEPIYHDCGQFYICKTEAFRESNSLITKDTIAYEVSEEEMQDIDNYSDWNIAEIKYSNLTKE